MARRLAAVLAITASLLLGGCGADYGVDQHGNTSAASIPLALATAASDGRIKKGDLVLLEAMGGGFTWGSVLLRW